MTAPWQALVAVSWALVGPPLLVYAATRVRRGAIARHAGLMLGAAAIEIGILVGFGALENPSPRRELLVAQPLFRIHLALAIGALVGMVWQVGSRLAPPLRRWHRRSGPVVVAVWCLALLTGIYNFVFLYLST
jgi:uncharacterized membrane protein YozB (DUF420 family)